MNYTCSLQTRKLKQETDYKILFESLPGSYLVLLPDLSICAVSDDYLKATLTKRPEIIGRNIFDVFPENAANSAASAIKNLDSSLHFVLKYKEKHTMAIQRYDMRTPNGRFEERYWSPVNKPILNADNEVIYIIHAAEDVTDFILSSNKLHKNERMPDTALSRVEKIEIELMRRSKEIAGLNRQLEQIVEERTAVLTMTLKDVVEYKTALDVSNIISVTDQYGTIQYANDNFCKISKFSRSELEGKNHRIIKSGYHTKEFYTNMWNTISAGNIWRGEIKNKAKDGTFYWVDTTIVPFTDWRGMVYKYLSIRTDITERNQFLEELILSEENYRNLFENALVGLSKTDMRTSKPVDVNEYCAKLFGYASKKDFIARYEPKLHMETMKERDELLFISQKKGQHIKRDQKIIRLDGSVIWVDLYIKLSNDGRYAQTILTDVTAQKLNRDLLEKKVIKRTQKLSMLLEKEKELNEIKSRFVSFASHEFRTPLTVIFSSASLEKMYAKDNNQVEREKLADSILSSVRDLTAILDNFLSLAKIENRKIELHPEHLILPGFIQDIIKQIHEVTGKKNQVIHYTHEGEDDMLQSKSMLKNILVNLISNASKYSQAYQPIEISSSIRNGRVRVTVKDYGIGIPEKDQELLFSEFFRAGNVGNVSGTGLGLSIVKKYVELLQGTLQFTSKCKEGSSFTIDIPQRITVADLAD